MGGVGERERDEERSDSELSSLSLKGRADVEKRRDERRERREERERQRLSHSHWR